jgi:hypothetical protein
VENTSNLINLKNISNFFAFIIGETPTSADGNPQPFEPIEPIELIEPFFQNEKHPPFHH